MWQLVFKALELLVRTDHPHREFNIAQLKTAGITQRLMHLCQVRTYILIMPGIYPEVHTSMPRGIGMYAVYN